MVLKDTSRAMSKKGLTGEELVEFFNLEWIEDKGEDEGNHGRTYPYDYSGWAIDGEVIIKSRYPDPNVLLQKDVSAILFSILVKKVKRLETKVEELEELRHE